MTLNSLSGQILADRKGTDRLEGIQNVNCKVRLLSMFGVRVLAHVATQSVRRFVVGTVEHGGQQFIARTNALRHVGEGSVGCKILKSNI